MDTIKHEFPDFPESSLPGNIPDWLKPSHWHNDTCPSWTFTGPHCTLSLFIDYPDPSMREVPAPRFCVRLENTETFAVVSAFESDDWDETQAALHDLLQEAV